MGVSYRSGRTPESVIAGFQRRKVQIVNEAEKIVDETVTEGLALQRRLLDLAFTRTGSERFAKNSKGSAGRNEEGDLIAGTSKQTERVSKTRIEGRYGWLSFSGEDELGKIQAQELGGSPSNIPPAHSLLDSYVALRAKFIARMKRLGR
jgi:hypothetical protein